MKQIYVEENDISVGKEEIQKKTNKARKQSVQYRQMLLELSFSLNTLYMSTGNKVKETIFLEDKLTFRGDGCTQCA